MSVLQMDRQTYQKYSSVPHNNKRKEVTIQALNAGTNKKRGSCLLRTTETWKIVEHI